MQKPVSMLLVLTLLGAAACSQSEEPPKPRATAGREETRNIRNTEAVGYSGDAIADKLDAALDANDQYKEKQDQAIEEQTE